MNKTFYTTIIAFCILFICTGWAFEASATQLSGSYTINTSGTASATLFNDFSSALTYLTGTGSRADGGPSNSGTTGVSGAVTFNVASGTTYTLSSALVIPAISGASSSNTITFKKNGSGANPVIYGYKGSGSADGIVIMLGTSYVTFDGIDVQDPSTNTSTSTQMEWGYALLRTSTPVGCQYNIIQNCSITLNRANTNTVGIFGDCYSWSSGSLSSVTVKGTSGATSYNGFYKNNISNCFTPIFIRGYSSGSSSYVDLGNDVGSKGGNTISAFGYGSSTSPYSNPYTGATVNGIMLYQQGDTYYINNNTITLTASDNVSVVLNGISSVAWNVAVTGSNPVIKNNTLNLVSTATASAMTGIANNQGTGSTTEDVENNVITAVNTTATGAANFIGINIQSTIPSGKYIYNNNEIKNCKIYGTGYFYGISSVGGGNPGSQFSFSGNLIHDNIKDKGSSGDMYLIHFPVGSVPLTQANNQIYNNINNCGNLYGIYNTSGTSTESIHDNSIYNLSTSTSNTVTGIYCNNSNSSVRNIYKDSISSFSTSGGTVYGININAGSTTNIYKNKLYFPSGAFAGIMLGKITMSSSNPGIVANNFISIGGSGAANFGIYDNGGTYHSVYYNSILMASTGLLCSGIMINASTSGSNINYENNCSVSTGGAYAVYVVASTGLSAMDYNNYYTNGTYLGVFGSTSYAKLSDWKSGSSLDAHSVSVNPNYKSGSDLHHNSKAIARAGTGVSAVTDDIDGKPRHPGPTIGANEITPFKLDLGLAGLNNPVFGTCGDSFTAISVNTFNFGTDTAVNPVVYAIVNGPTGSGTYTDTIKKKLAYDSSALAVFAKTFNTSAGGTWAVKIYTALKNDSDRTNDTIYSVVTLNSHSPQPSVTGNAVCGYGSMRLSATRTFAADSIYWYDNASATTLVGVGDTFRTPNISHNVNFYAQERMPSAKYYTGLKSTSSGATSSTMATAGFKFNALTQFTIDSATVYPVATGTIIINLLDSLGKLMHSLNIPATVSSSGAAIRIPLHLLISKGNGYFISINDSATGGLIYNTSGASYPYKISNVISILNPIGGSGSSASYNGLYNILLHTGNCGSTLVPVLAAISTPSVTLSNDLSSKGKTNGGTASNPDRVCAGSTMIYDLTTNLANGGYGTAWTITSKSIKTPSGTYSKDTSFTNPNLKNPGKFAFVPKASSSDSLYIVSLTVKTLGKLSCDSTVIRYIYVSPLPKVKFGIKNACLGSPVIFSDSSSITSGNIANWNWDFGDSKSSSTQNPAHIYTKAAKFSVILSATSDFGCSGSISNVAEEFPFPVAKFGVITGCQDYGTTFLDSGTIITGSIATYNWSFGDGTKDATPSPIHIYSKSGYFNVKQVITSASGCKDSLTKKIRIMPKPTASFNYVNACVGLPVYIANTSFDSTSGTSYLWDFGDKTTSASSAPIHTYMANGTFRIKLTVTTKSGCIDTAIQTITPYPKPIVNFFHTTACTGKTISFTDSGKNVANSLYSWNFGDAGVYVSKSSTAAHSYAKAGTYKVKLIINSPSACSDSETVIVTVTDLPKPDFSALDVCLGKATNFKNNSTPSSGLAYSWNFGDGSNHDHSTSPSHYYNTAKIFSVMLSVTNSNGCADSVSKVIKINPLPVVGKWSASVHNYSVRYVPSDTSEQTYKWYFGTGDSSSIKKPVYIYPSVPKKYAVKLTVTNAGGCSSSTTDSITLKGTGIEASNSDQNMVSVYPNPFENSTMIKYTLNSYSTIHIAVYDLNGKLISIIREGKVSPGTYSNEFLPSAGQFNGGIYILRMIVNGNMYVKRIVRIVP